MHGDGHGGSPTAPRRPRRSIHPSIHPGGQPSACSPGQPSAAPPALLFLAASSPPPQIPHQCPKQFAHHPSAASSPPPPARNETIGSSSMFSGSSRIAVRRPSTSRPLLSFPVGPPGMRSVGSVDEEAHTLSGGRGEFKMRRWSDGLRSTGTRHTRHRIDIATSQHRDISAAAATCANVVSDIPQTRPHTAAPAPAAGARRGAQRWQPIQISSRISTITHKHTHPSSFLQHHRPAQ